MKKSCALHVCWENLAEIRSLAVVEEAQGQGIGRQHAHRGNAQRQILDGVEAQQHHGVVNGNDFPGQAVVDRIHHPQDLDGDDGVFVDHLHQLLRGAGCITGQLQNALHADRKSLHLLHRRHHRPGKFGMGGVHGGVRVGKHRMSILQQVCTSLTCYRSYSTQSNIHEG